MMMKRMKSISISCLFLLCGLFLWQETVLAGMSAIYDYAGLFPWEEYNEINDELQRLYDETDMDYLVVTITDAEGKSSQEYADDFYEDSGAGTGDNHSGMLYLIDMDNREIYISTEGDMLRYLTDERLDVILDNAYEEVADGNYAASALSVLRDTGDFIAEGIPEDQYNYSSETGDIDPYFEEESPLLALLFGSVMGLIAALCFFFSVRGRYRLSFKTYHYPLSEKSGLKLTVSEDRLINQFVTHRHIPKPTTSSSGPSGSGRTTTHRSSSGRVHGGGGRKF